MLDIYIDADACPVKDEAYGIAERYSLKVFVVSNHPKVIPKKPWLTAIVVEARFDAVDDWIEGHIQKDDIAITNDLLLAARCIKAMARVVDPRGRIIDEDNIGELLATRELMTELRQSGALDTGPKGMGKKHRSGFKSSFDLLINQIKKANK